ncbi:MAG: ABATE domain-containing protein [Terracidiphilus sp.]
MKTSDEALNQPALLSDHPVLEFLNTVLMVEGELQDVLQTDADVLKTLTRIGWPTKFEGTGLLAVARNLRKLLRQLVESRKAGDPLHLAQFNKFLAEAQSHLEVCQNKKGPLAVHRVWKHRTPQQALAPVAESAVDLLANGDFHLIRRCESETCVLWFYDRTRSHHRRWCSMASCGNRHKVAAFRKRSSEP